MGLNKGQTNNPNGRPRGIPNKVSQNLRILITDFLDTEFPTVLNDFQDLQPKDRLKFYTDLLQYGLPKLQSTTLEIDFEQMNESQLDYIIEQLKITSNEQARQNSAFEENT